MNGHVHKHFLLSIMLAYSICSCEMLVFPRHAIDLSHSISSFHFHFWHFLVITSCTAALTTAMDDIGIVCDNDELSDLGKILLASWHTNSVKKIILNFNFLWISAARVLYNVFLVTISGLWIKSVSSYVYLAPYVRLHSYPSSTFITLPFCWTCCLMQIYFTGIKGQVYLVYKFQSSLSF